MLGNSHRSDDTQFWFVGAGIGSLAGAAYLLRDCGFEGKNIHIIESLPIPGGSNDGAGDPERGWVARGERMFSRITYENFWDIFGSIPSPEHPGRSVTDDMFGFADRQPVHANTRFVNAAGAVMSVEHYGLNPLELRKLLKLVQTKEEDLQRKTIEDWFGRRDGHFFKTNFWYCYLVTFAFTPWTSVMEFRRYVIRLMPLILRLRTAEGVVLTERDQYDGLIKPLLAVLEEAGVDFTYDTTVVDMDFAAGPGMTVTALRTRNREGIDGVIAIPASAKVVATLGCMTDNATFGTLDTPAVKDCSYPMSATLWKNIARKKAGLGNPDVFFGHPDQSDWMTFNCTFAGNTLMDWLESWSGNKTGQGLSTSFVESPWSMELRNPTPPYWSNQGADRSYLWMCAFTPNGSGIQSGKPMWDCTGAEILDELLGQLPMDEATKAKVRSEVLSAIPVAMPYINAHFLPRALDDRPLVIPADSTNLAIIGQYAEIADDITFTEEYSVRGARMAVYGLLGMKREVAPVKPFKFDVRLLAGVIAELLK